MAERPGRWSTVLLLGGLLLLALGLRLWRFDVDPPPVDLVRDEAPWTDEGTLALPALQAIRGEISFRELLGQPHRLLLRLALYGTFRLLGPGQVQARLLVLALGLAGLLGLSRLGRRLWPQVGPPCLLLWAGVSFPAVVYDRTFLSEGPLTALLILLTLLGLKVRTVWGALGLGLALGIVTVGVKVHAVVLLPGLLALYGLRRRTLVLPLAGGWLAVFLFWRWVWIPHLVLNPKGYAEYLQARLGGRMGLASPQEFLLQLALPTFPSLYLVRHLPLALLAALEGYALLRRPRRWLATADDLLLVSLPWLAAILGLYSLFRYLPARYILPAGPPLFLLALAGARRLWEGNGGASLTGRWDRFLRLGYVVGIGFPLGIQLAVLPQIEGASWLLGPLGLAVPPILLGLLGLEGGKRGRKAAVVLLILAYLGVQGGLYAQGYGRARPDLSRAARVLAAELPPETTVVGRLAGTLSLNAPLRAEPLLDEIPAWAVRRLARRGPVALVILEGDEGRIDPDLWPRLERILTLPVRYSSGSQHLYVYRYAPGP